VREVKQLDDGIGDTFVSSVLENVSFAWIDFQASWMEKSRNASGMNTRQSIESTVQLRGSFCWLAECVERMETLPQS
jgi:hypothetical protein